MSQSSNSKNFSTATAQSVHPDELDDQRKEKAEHNSRSNDPQTRPRRKDRSRRTPETRARIPVQKARGPRGPEPNKQEEIPAVKLHRGNAENKYPATREPKLETRTRVKRGRQQQLHTRKRRMYQRMMSNTKSYFWTYVQHTYTGKRDDLRHTPPRWKSLKYRACLCYG